MSNRTLNLTDELYQYVLSNSLRESELMQELRTVTAQLPEARMQIAPEQGQFMALLVQLMGARRTIEVGVFTGYSALTVAQALPADGQVIGCDVSKEFTDIAQPFWQRAGVADNIDLRLAPALDTLDGLLADGEQDSFDFAFIDADKTNYQNYYERCLQLIRPGGLIVVDNVLWSGSVVDAANNEADTVAIRAFNQAVHSDQRVELTLLPVADGLTLLRKR